MDTDYFDRCTDSPIQDFSNKAEKSQALGEECAALASILQVVLKRTKPKGH